MLKYKKLKSNPEYFNHSCTVTLLPWSSFCFLDQTKCHYHGWTMGLANTQTALYLLMTHQQCEGDLYTGKFFNRGGRWYQSWQLVRAELSESLSGKKFWQLRNLRYVCVIFTSWLLCKSLKLCNYLNNQFIMFMGNKIHLFSCLSFILTDNRQS